MPEKAQMLLVVIAIICIDQNSNTAICMHFDIDMVAI